MRVGILLRKIAFIIVFVFISSYLAIGSSCLPGWRYQMEIDVTNSGSTTLSDFQVKLDFNSASYVAAGKMNISGSDIRFMDDNNNLLSYWIVPGTFNTTNTTIWIKIPEVPVGGSVIYMYYGNNAAYNASNGEETFDFFDDFERGTDNWNFCGGGYYLSDGNLVLYSNTSSNNQALMTTNQSFSAPFISEMDFTSVSGNDNKQISIVQIKSDAKGFGLTSIQTEVNDRMEITKYDSGTDCFSYETSLGYANLSSGLIGTWKFVWLEPNNQQGIKGEGDVNLQGIDADYDYPNSLYTGAAVYGTTASVSLDWFRVRKWADSEPTIILNTSSESELPDAGNINISTNAPICEGETLTLYADDIGNADYTWYRPNGTVLTTNVIPNPITGATTTDAGTYQLLVEPYSGSCTSITLDLEVEINPNTDAGIIEGSTEVCALENSGFLELENYIGEIIRWEYSLTGGDPWATIENTSSRQDYQNLMQTTYYRAVVKSGECSQEKSEIATVTVHSVSDAGAATGDAVICKNESTDISLSNYNGDMISWERSLDESVWNTAGFSLDNFNTGSLDTTTFYRAIVTNGTCDPDTSNVVSVIVNCESVGGIVEKDTVCYGSSGEIEVTDYTGNILRWEESENGGKPWTIIQESENKLVYENITQTKFYRVVVQNPGCDTVYSVTGGVIVDKNPVVNQILGAETVCSQVNSGDIVLSDYTGAIKNWEFSDDNENTWQNISSLEDTIQYSGLEQTTFYRAKIESNYNKCSNIVSGSIKITVKEPTLGGITTGSTTVCSDKNEGVIKLSLQRGEILRWERSNTGKNPWEVIATTTDSLHYINLNENTYYRAVIQNEACETEYSDSSLIQVNQPSNAGIITGSASHCAENNQGTLILTGYTGTVTKWERSEDKLLWNYKNYITPNTVEYNNLTDSTYYRVIVQNGVCLADTSEISSVKIYPLPIVNFEADTAELGEATHFNNKSSIVSGNLTEYQWDFDNGTSSTAKNPIHTYTDAKTYFVSLKVKSDKGCLDSIKKAVLVNPKPQVDFNYENVCLGDTMYFTNNSSITSGTVTYEWDLGDGNTSVLKDTYNVYNTDGTYQVTLTATTDKGVQSSVTKTVQVYSTAALDFDLHDACENETVTFINRSVISNGYLNFYWDFGDGNNSTLLNPDHSYQDYGEFQVELISVSDNNCRDTLTKSININPNPIADFYAEDVPYQTVAEFIDNSTIPSGTIDEWSWNFGDGNFSNIQNPEYLYSSPGNYLASLKVTSDFGCTQSINRNIDIFPLPHADFAVENVCYGNPVHFSNQSTVLSGDLNYEWNFGDGITSQEESPSHSYQEFGVYTVTLVATSSSNGTDSVHKTVDVYPIPEPDFSVTDVCDGLPSYFINHSSIDKGSINSCSWDFGDGTNSIQYNPVKQYLNPDVYNVELKTISEAGCEASVTKDAYVRKNPLADFNVSNVCIGENINITNHTKSEEGNISYFWEFGDGSNSVIENPDHNYAGSGVYIVKLLAKTSYQCVDSLSRYVTIFSLPQVDAGVDTSVSRGFSVVLQASGANIYDWSPGESLDNPGIYNPVARPMETTTYTVRGIDVNGCENTDDVTVNVDNDYQVIANNILTPDYNGLNDTWTITNIDAFETATVYIFNRWGEEVYSKKGYMNDWDGRNKNGDILPDGTYYYIIKFPNRTEHYSGSITILRNQ